MWWCPVGCCVRVILVPRFCFWCHLCWFEVWRCFVLWLIVVCEWVCCSLFLMGSCIVCAWCCCHVLCGCVNGASPVRFVLSLYYLCAFQMNSVCCVCGYIWLRFVFLFICCDRFHKSKWLECVCLCVSLGQDLTRRPPLLWGAEPARHRERLLACPKNGIGPPYLGAGIVWTSFVQLSAAFQPRAGCVLEQCYSIIIIIVSSNLCLPSLHAFIYYIVETFDVIQWAGPCKNSALHHVCGIFCYKTALTRGTPISVSVICCMWILYVVDLDTSTLSMVCHILLLGFFLGLQ